MSNDIVRAPERPAPAADPPTDAAPALRLVVGDDALLCVDDACLPPELRAPERPDEVAAP